MYAYLLAVYLWLKSFFDPPIPKGRHFFLVRDPALLGQGLVVFGVKGSGKTTIILKLLNKAWERGEAVIAIDTGDFLHERAKRMCPAGTDIYRYNVTRKDGWGIDLAKLADTEPRLLTVVEKLLPGETDGRLSFWVSNGRGWLLALIRSLNHFAPREWLPMDLCWLVTHRALAEAVIDATNGIVTNPLTVMGRGQAGADVAATVQGAILPIIPFASLCDHLPLHNPMEVAQGRKGTISLEWADSISAALSPMYAIVLDVCGTEANSAKRPETPITFSCDEVRSLAKMNFLRPMALRGRRSKCHLMFSVHEMEGMEDRYGSKEGNEIVNVQGIKVFLRIGGNNTVMMASKTFGKIEFIRAMRTTSDEHKLHYSVLDKYLIQEHELYNLPFPDPENDILIGVCHSKDQKGWFRTKFVEETKLETEDIDFGTPCPPEWYTPRARGEADLIRLGIPLTDAVVKALNK